MIIEVTQEDVNNGIKYDCSRCPIALAIRKKFTGDNSQLESAELQKVTIKKVVVGTFLVSLYFEKQYLDIDYYLPAEVKKWIRQFDSGKPVEPLTFELTEVYK